MRFKNKFVMNTVLAAIRHHNFTPIDIEFKTGYFIWYSGDDSVMHFHIKEIKDWKFGVWLSYNEDTTINRPEYCNLEIQFFAQYEPEIDKFKPSNSVFTACYTGVITNQIYTRKEITDFDYFEFINIIKHIKTNPKLAYTQEMNFSLYLQNSFISEYIAFRKQHYKNKIADIKRHIIKELVPSNYNKLSAKLAQKFSNKNNLIDFIEVKDCNTDYITSFPRYEVHIHFNMISSDKEEQRNLMKNWVKGTKLFTMRNTSFRFFLGEYELS